MSKRKSLPNLRQLTDDFGGLFGTPQEPPQKSFMSKEPKASLENVVSPLSLVSEPVEEVVVEEIEAVPVEELTELQKMRARVDAFLASQVSITPLSEYGEPIPELVDMTTIVDGKSLDYDKALRGLQGAKFVWGHDGRTFCRMAVMAPEDAWENVACEKAQMVCNALIVSHVHVIVVAFERNWSKQVEFDFYLSPNASARFMTDADFEKLRRK